MSCLFRSLGTLIKCDEDRLRQDICAYLETNPDLMGDGTPASTVVGWESGQDFGSYVGCMRRRSTWGGAIEITAFVHMTGCEVVVHDVSRPPSVRTITFMAREPRRNVRLHISWNGGHYEPMRLVDLAA
jgi:hypothetical protein